MQQVWNVKWALVQTDGSFWFQDLVHSVGWTRLVLRFRTYRKGLKGTRPHQQWAKRIHREEWCWCLRQRLVFLYNGHVARKSQHVNTSNKVKWSMEAWRGSKSEAAWPTVSLRAFMVRTMTSKKYKREGGGSREDQTSERDAEAFG